MMDAQSSILPRINSYQSQFNQINMEIFNALKKKRGRNEKLIHLNEKLPEMLLFCDVSDSEKELVETVISDLIKKPENVDSADLVEISTILLECKSSIKKFISEYTDARYSAYQMDYIGHDVEELKKYVCGDEQTGRQRIVQRIRDAIYTRPGRYIKTIHTELYKEYGLSYTAIRNYINDLEENEAIITVGGPQGKYRYCFPNPSKIKDRSTYYGKWFGIKKIKPINVSEDFKNPAPTCPFYSIYYCNTNIKPMLLMIPLGSKMIQPGASIEAYGKLKPFEYLLDCGYQSSTEKYHCDALFGSKVASVFDSTRMDVWIDRANSVIDQ